MIRNADTCGAYAIRPYPDGRKDLFLRSILGYVKWHDPFLDPKNGYVESIISLFESIKGYVKRHDLLFDPKKNHAKRHSRYFCRGILHTTPQGVLKRNV